LENSIFDYIVIGSGSSGSVVASRLSENPNHKVLIVEAGGSDKTPMVLIPGLGQLKAYGNPKYDWRYIAEPDPTRNGAEDYMPRGRVLGGTSSINAMSYVRGTEEDFDTWADLGCSGWAWKDVLPYFKKSESFEGGGSKYRGSNGPLAVSFLRSCHPLSKAFFDSAVNAGMKKLEDYNAPAREGIGFVQATQLRGVRHSASRAYLWPAMKRSNLVVLKNTVVKKIIIDGSRAQGIECFQQGKTYNVSASKGVILSAGTFGSPHLLMHSGVGPSKNLKEHGIQVNVDLEGVGKNLQDHAGTAHSVWVNRSTYNTETKPWHYVINGINWCLTGRGPASSPTAQVQGTKYWDKNGTFSRVQYLFTPGGFKLGISGPEFYKRPAVTGLINLHRPYSKGYVYLKSNNPFDLPAVQPNLLSDSRDVEALLKGHKFIREIFTHKPLSRFVVEEFSPGKNVISDEEWRVFIRETAIGVYHPAGTCKMGKDKDAVVDEKLRVKGIDSLYIADASIMPNVVSGNLNANCVMIGEKAADIITDRQNR